MSFERAHNFAVAETIQQFRRHSYVMDILFGVDDDEDGEKPFDPDNPCASLTCDDDEKASCSADNACEDGEKSGGCSWTENKTLEICELNCMCGPQTLGTITTSDDDDFIT